MGRSRKHSTAGLYHVVSRGVGGQIIFEDDSDRRHFLALLKRASTEHDVKIAAWCLMDNHFHLIVMANLDDLSSAMRWLKGRYAFDANKRYKREGHLFQSVYASYPINDESYLAAAVQYIHANPVRAGIVPDPLSYPWSSAREYRGELFLVEPSLMPDIEIAEKRGPNDRHLLYTGAKISDEEAISLIRSIAGVCSPTDIKSLPRDKRNESIREILAIGVGNNQLARLTGIAATTISKIKRIAGKGAQK